MRDKTVEHNSWELDHESGQHVNRIMATWLPYLASMQDTMPGHACRTAACPHVLSGLTLGFSPEHQPPIQALVSVEDCLEGIYYFEVPHQNTFAMLDGWLPGRFAREDVQHRIKNCCSLACGFRVNGEMFSLALVLLGIFLRRQGSSVRICDLHFVPVCGALRIGYSFVHPCRVPFEDCHGSTLGTGTANPCKAQPNGCVAERETIPEVPCCLVHVSCGLW